MIQCAEEAREAVEYASRANEEMEDALRSYAGNCPQCHEGVMQFHQSDHVEPHGERVHEEWFECPECGEITH